MRFFAFNEILVQVFFLFEAVNMVNYTDYILNVNPFNPGRNLTRQDITYYSFYILLESIC